MTEKFTCCLCRDEGMGKGNNAAPVANGRCCDKCDNTTVAYNRLKQLEQLKKLAWKK